MAMELSPYISFGSDAREAIEYYAEVFGGDPVIKTFDDYGSSGPDAERVMHARLETAEGLVILASDTPSGVEPRRGMSIQMSITGDDVDGMHSYWDQLAGAGTVSWALEKQPWGDEFGMCTDKFGVDWMISINRPRF